MNLLIFTIIGYSLRCFVSGSDTVLLRDDDSKQSYELMAETMSAQQEAFSNCASNPFDERIWAEIMLNLNMNDAMSLRLGGNGNVNRVFRARFIQNVIESRLNLQKMMTESRGCANAWLIRKRLREIPFAVSHANGQVGSMKTLFSTETLDQMMTDWEHRICQKVLVTNSGSDQEEVKIYFGLSLDARRFVFEFSNDGCRLLTATRWSDDPDMIPDEHAMSDEVLDLFVQLLLHNEAVWQNKRWVLSQLNFWDRTCPSSSQSCFIYFPLFLLIGFLPALIKFVAVPKNYAVGCNVFTVSFYMLAVICVGGLGISHFNEDMYNTRPERKVLYNVIALGALVGFFLNIILMIMNQNG